MRPYYEHAGITIYHGDCREVLPQIRDGWHDLVLTDPPYGISYSPLTGQGRTGKRTAQANDYHMPIDWDGSFPADVLKECCRIAKAVLWFCHWRFWPNVIESATLPIRSMIVWAKDCHTSPPCPLASQHELIAAMGDIQPTHFETNLWNEPIVPTWEFREHPNLKPIALICRALSMLDYECVLDPFMGSGVTLFAAKKQNRRAIGIEIEEKYCEIAAKRLSQEVLQFSEPR